MAQLTYDYYSLKLYFCRLNPKCFFQQLEAALTNNTSIVNVEIPQFNKYKIGHVEYEKELELENIKCAHEAFEHIKDFLRNNKENINLQRRKDIFKVWFHWLLGSNMVYWADYKEYSEVNDPFPFNLDVFSLSNLFEFAKSILYEVDCIECCFDFANSKFIENGVSVYYDMLVQPENLTRAICSQSVDNVKFLVENVNFKLESITYSHSVLINPLQWAYYCDNLEIFNYLIKKGCSLEYNSIFYNSDCMKNFKFGLSLFFIKEQTKFKDIYIYDLLKFDRTEFMLFSLYEEYSEDQIIEIFESLFKSGFSLFNKSEIIEIYNLNDVRNFNQNPIEECIYSQLLPSICQNGIKSNVIKYLTAKYSEQNDQLNVQNELRKLVKQCTLFYQFNLFPKAKPKLKIKDLINILTTILPMLNKSSIEALKNSSFSYRFLGCHLKTYSHKAVYKLIDDNFSNYLFERVDFKLLNIFVSYELLNHDNFIVILNYLSTPFINQSFKEQLKILSGFIYYFIDNDILNKLMVKDWLKYRLSDIELMDIDAENVNDLKKVVYLYCDSKICNPKSLLNLSRFAIRRCLCSFSDQTLKSLNLPTGLEAIILNSIKPNKQDFFLYVKF